MNSDIPLILLLIVPLIGIFISAFCSFWKTIPRLLLIGLTIVPFIIQAFTVLIILPEVQRKDISSTFVKGLGLDWLSTALLLIGSIIFLLASLFSIYYLEIRRYGIYSTLLMSMQLGMNLVLMTQHLFSLFIFWELMVISGYVLVSFEKTKEALEAGFKYTIISSVGSISMLMGIALLSGSVPSLYFDDILNNPPIPSPMLTLGFIFTILGFGVTGGVVAFNQWLPDAHPAAPAPVSALLSGVIVKAGIYGMYRSINLFYPNHSILDLEVKIIIILGLLTVIEGNLMVLAQLQRKDSIDLKRIFAYSTTTHLGYLIMTVALTTELSKVALMYHIVNHAIAKSLLFLLAGYLIKEYGTRDLIKLRSMQLGKNRGLALFIFVPLMSLGGLPLTGGFVSKLLILVSISQEASSSGFLLFIMIMAVINSSLAFGGYLWIIRELLFVSEGETIADHKIPRIPNFIFIILMISILLLGLIPFAFINPFMSTL